MNLRLGLAHHALDGRVEKVAVVFINADASRAIGIDPNAVGRGDALDPDLDRDGTNIKPARLLEIRNDKRPATLLHAKAISFTVNLGFRARNHQDLGRRTHTDERFEQSYPDEEHSKRQTRTDDRAG